MIFVFYTCSVFLRRLGILMGIMLILSGCNIGILTSTTSKHAAEEPSPSPSASKIDSELFPIAFSVANLLSVRSTAFMRCDATYGFAERSLVLATGRLTYDQAETNQMAAFMDSQGEDLGYVTNGLSTLDTLRYITGSIPVNMIKPGEQQNSTACNMFLEMTNISKETIQISQMKLRYLRSAGPNTQLYRLINVCSIGKRTHINCPPQTGTGGRGYGADFKIGMGPTNTIYSDNPGRYESDASGKIIRVPPILRPGDLIRFSIDVEVRNYESGFFVSTIPEMVVTTPHSRQLFVLSRLKMDIAIAAPQNVSCYTLKGNMFVKQKDWTKQQLWCL